MVSNVLVAAAEPIMWGHPKPPSYCNFQRSCPESYSVFQVACPEEIKKKWELALFVQVTTAE